MRIKNKILLIFLSLVLHGSFPLSGHWLVALTRGPLAPPRKIRKPCYSVHQTSHACKMNT